MAIQRACIECGATSDQARCPKHRTRPWASASPRRAGRSLSGWAEQRRARRIIRRDNGLCHVCGRPGADQVDHKVPVWQGGADHDSNLGAIHSKPCHEEKTQREAVQARARRASQ